MEDAKCREKESRRFQSSPEPLQHALGHRLVVEAASSAAPRNVHVHDARAFVLEQLKEKLVAFAPKLPAADLANALGQALSMAELLGRSEIAGAVS